MAQYTDLLDHINTIVPGVARPIVLPLIPLIVKTFCEKSRIWRADFTVTLTREDMGEVVNLATQCRQQLAALDATLVDVVELAKDGETIPYSDYSRRAREGFVLRRRYPPGDFTVTAALTPSSDATDMPDHLLDDWAEPLAYGVAHKLAMQPRKDWTDIQLAQEYRRLFKQGHNEALFEANNNRQTMQSGGKYKFY